MTDLKILEINETLELDPAKDYPFRPSLINVARCGMCKSFSGVRTGNCNVGQKVVGPYHFQKYKNQIQFRFTLTSIHANVLAEWEPGAPSFEERLSALESAYYAGYKTSISCEPALDEIEDIQRLYDFTFPYLTESFWIGKMNHVTGPARWTSHEVYEAFVGKPLVRFKDSIRKDVGLA